MRKYSEVDRFNNAGLTFEVQDSGPADGEPIVLLHGFPERANSWDLIIGRLHEQGYRTIAYDQRGYSPGARPRRVRDYTVPLIAGDLRALIDVVGRPVHLVGHDWGAVVSWYAAARFPDQLRSLTALSVPHPTAYLRSLLGRQGLTSWYLMAFYVPGLMERFARKPGGLSDRVFAAKGGMRPDDIARFHREIDAGALKGGLNWYRATAFGLADRPRPVAIPTTYVWGDEDGAVARSAAHRCVNYCTGPYRFIELPGVSHWTPRHAPDVVADAILAQAMSVDEARLAS